MRPSFCGPCRKWTPRHATLPCSPPCRCSAQSPLGRGIAMFLARSFLRSVQSRFSAQPMGSSAEMDQLILKRASASRPSGEWNDDDFDVLADGFVVGHITYAAAAAVLGTPWLWTLAYGQHEDRTPT